MKDYKKLIVWQKSIDLVKQVYLLTKQLPQEERFGLISQINRAVVSIPANIAEGSSRTSDKDYARFLQISLGSAFELQTYYAIIKSMEWDTTGMGECEFLTEGIIKMLHGFIKQLNATC